MTNYIMVENNLVTNTIVADDKDSVEQLFNCTLIEITDGVEYQVGWMWDGTKFYDPNIEQPI